MDVFKAGKPVISLHIIYVMYKQAVVCLLYVVVDNAQAEEAKKGSRV